MPHRAGSLATAKAEFFRTLGHPARVRILAAAPRRGEQLRRLAPGELGLDSGGTSQQLAALRRIGLVEGRRDGTSVYYRVTDEAVFALLDAARGSSGVPSTRAQALLDAPASRDGARCLAGAVACSRQAVARPG